jgi:hypothetical protein
MCLRRVHAHWYAPSFTVPFIVEVYSNCAYINSKGSLIISRVYVSASPRLSLFEPSLPPSASPLLFNYNSSTPCLKSYHSRIMDRPATPPSKAVPRPHAVSPPTPEVTRRIASPLSPISSTELTARRKRTASKPKPSANDLSPQKQPPPHL